MSEPTTVASTRYPLDLLNIELMKMTAKQRDAADPHELAAKYQVREDWAEYYVRHWRSVNDGR